MRKIAVETILKSKAGRLNKELSKLPLKKRSSKYGAKKTIVDGIKFDSQKEAVRYTELKFFQERGLIKNLKPQVPYELNEYGSFSFKYIADFVYFDFKSEKLIVEDVKGYKTAVYKKKKKLMWKVYGIKIKET